MDDKGIPISQNLHHPWHNAQRRDTESTTTKDSFQKVHYKINLEGDDAADDESDHVHLELARNNRLVGPGFVVERQRGNSSTITNIANSGEGSSAKYDCHYTGKIRDHKDSSVALSLCDGMVSIIPHNLRLEQNCNFFQSRFAQLIYDPEV